MNIDDNKEGKYFFIFFDHLPTGKKDLPKIQVKANEPTFAKNQLLCNSRHRYQYNG